MPETHKQKKTAPAQNVVSLSRFRAQRNPPPAPPPPAALPPGAEWLPKKPDPSWWHLEAADWCLSIAETSTGHRLVSPREIGFLRSMTAWWALPTLKQAHWLEAIERRLEESLREPKGDGPPDTAA